MKISKLKGFTLAETLVVISIIAILAATGAPLYKEIQPVLELSGITREIITDIRYIQQLTVTEQIDHCLCFFPLDGEYERRYQLIRCGVSDPQCGQSNPILIKEKSFQEEIKTLTISGFTDNEIRYNPYGAANRAGTMTLTNIQDKTKTIEVKSSGFVKSHD